MDPAAIFFGEALENREQRGAARLFLKFKLLHQGRLKGGRGGWGPRPEMLDDLDGFFDFWKTTRFFLGGKNT